MSILDAAKQADNALTSQQNIQVVRTRSRRLSIRVMPDGSLNVRAPQWVGHGQINQFIHEKKAWIDKRQSLVNSIYNFSDGYITDVIRIKYKLGPKLSVESTGAQITVFHPADMSQNWWELYQVARPKIKRLLTAQAKQELPPIVQKLQEKYNLRANDVRLRFTRSRWGSCNRQSVIMLNTQLLRLPSELINYVISHELAHTKAFHHGPEFHATLESLLPDAKKLSKQLTKYPLLH